MKPNRGEAGRVTITDPGADRLLLEFALVQCCHCGGQFQLKPPRKIAVPLTRLEAEAKQREGKCCRGWCGRCAGYFCGPGCEACVPVEQYLENLEKGLPPDHRPVTVYVG